MNKIITLSIIALAAAFTACSDDSSSSAPSLGCEIKDTATGIQVVQSIPELGNYTIDYAKKEDGSYSDALGLTSMSYDEAMAAAKRDCDNFNGAN